MRALARQWEDSTFSERLYGVAQAPASTPVTPLVPLDELKLTREMQIALSSLPTSGTASRTRIYRTLAKTLLLWARRWRNSELQPPACCHQVMSLTFKDAHQDSDVGYFARALLRAASYYNMYPTGHLKCFIALLKQNELEGRFQGKECRLDHLKLELIRKLEIKI